MPRLLTITAAQVLGVWAIGVSASLAQEPTPRNEPAPRAEQRGAPAARQAAPKQPIDPAMMDWLLMEWEKQSERLKTLDVAILRIDDSPAWGDKDYYEGRALFKAPNLAFIDFNKIELDANKKPVRDPATKKFVSTPHERILCTGTEVWRYRSDVQQVEIFPLDKNFEGKPLGPPWKVIRHQPGVDRPRGGNLRGRGDGPADPAAARPAPGQRTQRR